MKYIKGNIWLLVVPLVRGMLSFKIDLLSWAKMAYMDIIVILIVFSLAWLRWNNVRFKIYKKGIYVKTGVVFQREKLLPYSVISCATVNCPFYLKPLRAVKIYLNTESASGEKKHKFAELTLIVSETDYSQIYKNIPFETFEKKITFCASKSEIIFYSMCFSSAIPGLLYLGTFIIQSSRIVGEKIEIKFLSLMNELAESIKKYSDIVTAMAVVLLIIIAVGWFMTFAKKIVRYLNFKVCRCGRNIMIENGHVSNWKYYVNYSRINNADICQNLLMKISKTMAVHINCSGYGNRKNEQPVFIPMTTATRAMIMMKTLLPEFTQSNIFLRTKRTYIMAYIWLPLFLLIGVAVVTNLFCTAAGEWESAVRFVGVMLEIPLVYLLIVKIVAKMSTGIGVSDKAVTVSYCRATRFHTVIVPKKRIAYIKIRRTLLQRASGCCDVIIYTRGERVRAHRVRGIGFADAVQLVESYDKIC